MTPEHAALSCAQWRRRPLLIQCWTNEALPVAPLANRPGGGMVITAQQGNTRGLYQMARYLRDKCGYRRPMLLDAARYATRNGDPADFDPDWLHRQRELGLPVLTDSGYLAEGNGEGLVRVLHRTAQLGEAIALLPLHPSWLVVPVARQRLRHRIRGFGVPVAILVEHVADPFDVAGAVDGLLEVLACGVPVLLLRSDAAALGALACGALAAAVGTSAALRHLHPARSERSAPSVFVRSCLSYQRLDQVEEARRRNPDAVLWRCYCPTCNGSDLDRILAPAQPRRTELAREHSVHVLLDLHDYLIGPDPCQDRASWRALCAAATFQRHQVDWGPSPALDRWQRAIHGSRTSTG